MGRRAYGKFWALKYRRGAIHKASVGIRGTWIELFALSLDSNFADDGIIQVEPGCGYTDEQLAKLCNIDVRTWHEHKKALADIGEIEILQGNAIKWLKWKETQTEYDRQKKYRAPRLHPKVTPEGYTEKLQQKLQGEERGERGEEEKGVVEKREKKRPKDRSPRIDPVAFREYWNSHPSLKRCRSMTSDRKRQLTIRSEAKDFREHWQEAVDALAKSPWHTGENDRGWRADVGWFLRNGSNWVKCLEQSDTVEAGREYSKKRVQAEEEAIQKRAEDEQSHDDITPEAQAFVDNLINKTGVNDG